jgi:nitroimidazol reductase NimA-like FMN-containing flavoprotein (pyridoxamine 5'-phosphate oxidase superfamily)
MIGTLNHAQIELLLHGQLIGRIGFRAGRKIFILPIAYAYEDGFIYAHSKEGTKIKAMRKNPIVCFEVDAIDNMANWRSVVLWGTFEELIAPHDRQNAIKLIADKTSPYLNSETKDLSGRMAPEFVEKPLQTVAYRIKISEESGRFEKLERARSAMNPE